MYPQLGTAMEELRDLVTMVMTYEQEHGNGLTTIREIGDRDGGGGDW